MGLCKSDRLGLKPEQLWPHSSGLWLNFPWQKSGTLPSPEQDSGRMFRCDSEAVSLPVASLLAGRGHILGVHREQGTLETQTLQHTLLWLLMFCLESAIPHSLAKPSLANLYYSSASF